MNLHLWLRRHSGIAATNLQQLRGRDLPVRGQHPTRALGLADHPRHRRLDLERLDLPRLHGQLRPHGPLQCGAAGAWAGPADINKIAPIVTTPKTSEPVKGAMMNPVV